MNYGKQSQKMDINNFLQYVDTQIQLGIKLGATTDMRRLTGFRNIKSEFLYTKEKNSKFSDYDVVSKLYKARQEAAEIYKNTNKDLYTQEIIEMQILEPFLPEELNWQDVFEFLNTLDIPKDKKNFKKFQTESETHFGQKVESSMILDFINS